MLVKHALMQNIIGPNDFDGEYEITYDNQTLQDLDHFNGRLYFHLYNKLESKPYRKLGHWVLLSSNQQSILELENEADTILQKVRVTPKHKKEQLKVYMIEIRTGSDSDIHKMKEAYAYLDEHQIAYSPRILISSSDPIRDGRSSSKFV